MEIVATADSAGCSHQSHAVVLDQNCRPDHSAVQFREPGSERDCQRGSCSVLVQTCIVRSRVFMWMKHMCVCVCATFLPGQMPCFQRRNRDASEAGCSPNGSTLKALTRQSSASSRDTGPHPTHTNTQSHRCKLTIGLQIFATSGC